MIALLLESPLASYPKLHSLSFNYSNYNLKIKENATLISNMKCTIAYYMLHYWSETW